jgi:hypothetical protein
METEKDYYLHERLNSLSEKVKLGIFIVPKGTAYLSYGESYDYFHFSKSFLRKHVTSRNGNNIDIKNFNSNNNFINHTLTPIPKSTAAMLMLTYGEK